MGKQHILLQQVLLTLAYTDQFQFPLSTQEIWSRLLCLGGVVASRSDVSIALQWLDNRQLVQHGQGFWSLRGRHGLVAQRHARALFSREKEQAIQSLISFIRWIPWVDAVALTGSVAVKNAKLADDTDFLIVTRPGSLWLVRPIVIAYAWWKGKRRSWRSEEYRSWCFNLWLEDSRLKLPQQSRSVYTAYECLQARWVFDRATIEKKFLRENSWVRRVLPNWHAESLANASISHGVQRHLLTRLFLAGTMPLWFSFNIAFFIAQRWYMAAHKTREKVDFSAAFFHPRDTGGNIAERWQNSLHLLTKPAAVSAPKLTSASKLPQQLTDLLELSQQERTKVILVTGVFDILHQEHVVFLEKARELGGCLVVGIESDSRVRKLKGPGRPIHTEQVRCLQVQAVPAVTAAFVLPDEFEKPEHYKAFMLAVRPNFLAVSSHSPHQENKRKLVEAVGGELVIVHEHNPAISSTQLLSVGLYTKVSG